MGLEVLPLFLAVAEGGGISENKGSLCNPFPGARALLLGRERTREIQASAQCLNRLESLLEVEDLRSATLS